MVFMSVLTLVFIGTFAEAQFMPMNTFPLSAGAMNGFQMPMGFNPQFNSRNALPSFNAPNLQFQQRMPMMTPQNMPGLSGMNGQQSQQNFGSIRGMQQRTPIMASGAESGQEITRMARPRQLAAPAANFQQDKKPTQTDGGSLPKFLEGVDDELISNFKRIIRQRNMAYDAKIKQVESEIVPHLDKTHQNLYRQFMSESDNSQQNKREAIHQTVNQMSQDAQQEFAQISQVLQDPKMGEEQRWQQITEMYSKFSPTLRNEFEQKFKPLV